MMHTDFVRKMSLSATNNRCGSETKRQAISFLSITIGEADSDFPIDKKK